MVDLRGYLEEKARGVISSWEETGIYAISFLVYANESYAYGGCSNVTEFAVSYNTESDCGGAGPLAEERWNYAFWRQNETYILEADEDCPGMRVLFDWYAENGVGDIGREEVDCYDEEMRYIGQGPGGYRELLREVTAVAGSLQSSGFIRRKFGRPVPIIIHDLEYSWYTLEATREANGDGEAELFLQAMREMGCAG